MGRGLCVFEYPFMGVWFDQIEFLRNNPTRFGFNKYVECPMLFQRGVFESMENSEFQVHVSQYLRKKYLGVRAMGDDDDFPYQLMISCYVAGAMTVTTAYCLWNRYSKNILNSMARKVDVLDKAINIETFLKELFGAISSLMTVYSIAHFASKCETVMDWTCLLSLFLKTKFGEAISESFFDSFTRAHGTSDYLKDIVTIFVTFVSVFITGFINRDFVANFFRWCPITGLSDSMKASSKTLSHTLSYYILKFVVWATVDRQTVFNKMMTEFADDERKVAILRTKPEILKCLIDEISKFSSGVYDRCTLEDLNRVGDVLTKTSKLMSVITSSKNMSVPEYSLVKNDFVTLSQLYKKKKIEISQLHRVEPVVVYICGPPSTGKSHLMNDMRDKIVRLEFASYEGTGGATYSRNSESKHWNGYRNHPLVTIDDVFQGDLNSNTEESKQIIQLVSTAPQRLEMAAISEKDTTIFTSEVLMLTSNCAQPVVKNNLEALTRRLAQNFIYVTKPTFSEIDGDFNRMNLYRWKKLGEHVNYPKVVPTSGLFPETCNDVPKFKWFSENFEKVRYNALVSDVIKQLHSKRAFVHEPEMFDDDVLDNDIVAQGDDDPVMDTPQALRAVDAFWANNDYDRLMGDILSEVPVEPMRVVESSEEEISSDEEECGCYPIYKDGSIVTVYCGLHLVAKPSLSPVLNDDVLSESPLATQMRLVEERNAEIESELRKREKSDESKRPKFRTGRVCYDYVDLLQMRQDVADDVHFKKVNSVLRRIPGLVSDSPREFSIAYDKLKKDEIDLLLMPVHKLDDPRFVSIQIVRNKIMDIYTTHAIDLTIKPFRVIIGSHVYNNVRDLDDNAKVILSRYLRHKIFDVLAKGQLAFTEGDDGFPVKVRSQFALLLRNGNRFGFSCDPYFRAVCDYMKIVNEVEYREPSVWDKVHSWACVIQKSCIDFVKLVRNNSVLFALAVVSIAAVLLPIIGLVIRRMLTRVKKAFGWSKTDTYSVSGPSWADMVSDAIEDSHSNDYGKVTSQPKVEDRGTDYSYSKKKDYSSAHPDDKKKKSKYNFHNRSGKAHGGEDMVEAQMSTGERFVDMLCNHMVKLVFHSDAGWQVKLNGIVINGGNVLVPKHLLSDGVNQSVFKFDVLCDDKRFSEEVPRAHISFPEDKKINGYKMKDFAVIHFRDMIMKRDIRTHFTRDIMSFGMLSKKKEAVVLKPSFRSDMPRVTYACPTTDVTNFSEYDYSDDRMKYHSKLYKISSLGIATALGGGDCGTLLVTQESGALRICGIYVAGNGVNNYFQPIVKEDLDKLCEFPLLCKGYELYPPVKEGRDPSVSYPTPMLGVYGLDTPNMRTISPTDLRESPISVECPEIFGHPNVSAPAVLDLESAQKAVIKKYHDVGTLDLSVVSEAKDWIETLYRPYIKDCFCGTAENGVDGTSHYGSLVGLDMSTSSGLPWKAFAPQGAKGKEWLFDEEGNMIDIAKKAVDETLDSWSRGYATPSVFNGTLKDEKRPLDRVAAKKTRIFTAGPFEKTVADRALFADFIVQFKEARLKIMHCYGINAESLEWNEMAYYHRRMGRLHGAADYSGFDASITSQLLAHAYDIVSRFYPEDSDKRMIDCSSVESRNHFVYMYGGIWHCAQGNPSGCVMTTVINCVVNHLLLAYAWIKHFQSIGDLDMVDFTSWRKHFVCHVYGDDFIYTVSDRAKTFSCKAYSRVLSETGQEITAPDKGEEIVDFYPWSKLTLLKRSFVVNPFSGPKTLFVGPVDKEVIEEIPRWMHKDSSDDALVSTVTATVRMAALWGKQYFDFVCAELRKSSTANECLSKICVSDIFREVSLSYVSAAPIAVRKVVAFYMKDGDTNDDDRCFSNLSTEHRFDYDFDGKIISVHSSEQAYGFEKAKHFNAVGVIAPLSRTRSGGETARLVHSIKGSHSTQKSWDLVKLEVMKKIIKAKFCVPAYANRLKSTDDAYLVEASPYDIYWGAGKTVAECRLLSPDRYPGANHLGRLLMELRASL